MDLPEIRIADWRPTKDTVHLYETAAGLAGRDIAAFGSAWCPTAEQLQQLV